MIIYQLTGFSITLDNIPPAWSWAPYLSFARWTFEGLMVNQWSRYDTDDTADDRTRDGNGDILATYQFDDFDKYDSFWILVLYMILFACAALYAMLPPKKKLLLRPPDQTTESAKLSAKSRGGRLDSRLSSIGWQTFESVAEITLATPITVGKTHTAEEETHLVHVPRMDSFFFRASTGQAIVTDGTSVVFHQLSYMVPNRNAQRRTGICSKTTAEENRSETAGPGEIQLLNQVSGHVLPGEMCALMGASGAGKSTLLDILAQRKNTGRITGQILYNRRPELKSFAYVMQESVQIGLLTVRETLYFAAELRLPESWPVEQKHARVEKILKILALDGIAESRVGDETVRGISGGQLKRLSIGVEIVHLPDLMFLDEPTTGLDSAISYEGER